MNLVSSAFPGMQHHMPIHSVGMNTMSNQRNPFAIQELLGLSLSPETGCHPHSSAVTNGLGHSSGGVCSIRTGSGFYPSSSHATHQTVNSCLSSADAVSSHHAAAATARMYFSNPSAAQLMNSYLPSVPPGPSFSQNHSQHVSSFLSAFPDCSGARGQHNGKLLLMEIQLYP